jgi:predicted nucleic acid-binding protein
MARRYFVDAWFYIASIDTFDSHYRQVLGLRRTIAGADLVTHDGVFAEVLAFFSEEGPHLRGIAAQAVRHAFAEIKVVASSGLFPAALDRYEARPDKEYSLVDCMSMVFMEQRGIHHVLTNDHHFAQAGFTVVSQ